MWMDTLEERVRCLEELKERWLDIWMDEGLKVQTKIHTGRQSDK